MSVFFSSNFGHPDLTVCLSKIFRRLSYLPDVPFHIKTKILVSEEIGRRMPNISLAGNVFNIKPLPNGSQHWKKVTQTLGQLQTRDETWDVRIHCRGKTTLRASKFFLASASKLLRSLMKSGLNIK